MKKTNLLPQSKKGVVWIPIILVGTTLVTFFLPQIMTYFTGRNTGIKISDMLNNLPLWFWILMIIILFLRLISGSKK